MKKTILIPIIFLLMISIVIAAEKDICEPVIKVGINCTMVSPPINCDTYSIFNISGTKVKTGNMTLWNESANIYYFIFNESIGHYVVALCDNATSREIVVEGEDMSSAIAIALSIFGVIFIIIGIILFLIKRNNE